MTGMAESVKLPAKSITAVQVDPKSAAELLNSTSLKSAPAVATSPAPPAVAGGALGKGHASLKFTEPSWASVCADGQKVFGRLMPAGEVREIRFSEKAVVRLGNAGGVEIALDGKPVGSLGQPGQLRLLELTSTGWRQLPTGDPADDCAKDRGN
jgi:cytoskeleton protein RodZ